MPKLPLECYDMSKYGAVIAFLVVNSCKGEKSPYLCIVLIQAIDCFTFNLSNKMKKLVFMFVAFAAISFASCGSKTETPAATNDSDSVAVDSMQADSVQADSVQADSVKA